MRLEASETEPAIQWASEPMIYWDSLQKLNDIL